MDVRRYRASDRAAVVVVGRRLTTGMATWGDPAAAAEAAAGWVVSSLAEAGSDGRAVFVAEQKGVVVGFVAVTEHAHFAGEVEGYVGELTVADTGTRSGTGRALMAAAEAWACGRGPPRLSLETGAANHGARAFDASGTPRRTSVSAAASSDHRRVWCPGPVCGGGGGNLAVVVVIGWLLGEPPQGRLLRPAQRLFDPGRPGRVGDGPAAVGPCPQHPKHVRQLE